ncbi:MAG: LysR family transcriptional regulator [Burkholderiales bacterium]|nr:LysR family transcriptional regulator [Burkholderiales bacterium]
MLDQRIRYFLTIAETGSLSEAAERLGVSQSGLSRQLKQLEDHLGRPLFTRTGRGVVLNDTGKRLEATARPAFAAIDQAVDLLRTEFGLVQGSIRIAMVHTLSLYFLPQLLAQFRHTYPAVNTYILGRGSPEVVNLVASGKVDLGFVYDVAVTIDGLDVERLFEERMCLVHHRDTPVDVPAHDGPPWTMPLITFPKNYALRQMLHRARLDRHVVAEVETVDAMLRLVSCKLGVCVLPDLIPDSEFDSLKLRYEAIGLPDLRRWVVGIRRADAIPSAAASHLMDLARAWRAA